MKPCSRKVLHSSNSIQNFGFGEKNTTASIKGSIRRLGEKYQNALVVLYNKANLQPISTIKPSVDGEYWFLGLNSSVNCFIVAFDQNEQYNAVISDGVVPK